MALNYIWIAFFLLAFVVALVKLVFLGDTAVFPEIINSTFASSKTAFEISLGLTGVLAGHHEDWRKRGCYPAFRPSAESAVFKTVSGDSQRTSGDGKYFHELSG